MQSLIGSGSGQKTVQKAGIEVPVTLNASRRFWQMSLLLVSVYGFFVAIYYITHFELKKVLAVRYGGWDRLIYLDTISIIPELVTLFGLQKVLLLYHRFLPIRSVRLTPLGLGRYYLSLLPPMLAVFFVISPFTQTVRFFLEVPITNGTHALTFNNYLKTYLIGPYLRPYIVALYSLLIPILGYCIVTVSLVRDLFSWRNQQNQSRIAEKPVETGYTTSLTVQSSKGQTSVLSSAVALITIESPNCLVHHQHGLYKLCNKTLTEVEADLNPGQFFRVNRGCLVNRDFVEGYAHTGNNNYIVHLKAPFNQPTVSLSRTRLAEFRHWLQVSVTTPVIKLSQAD